MARLELVIEDGISVLALLPESVEEEGLLEMFVKLDHQVVSIHGMPDPRVTYPAPRTNA